jgi:site-specific DNA recombinase
MDIRRIRAEMRMGRSFFDLPLRVTFYARVSTDQDEQLNSLENQVQYYTELIKSKPNWTFVPGYIDEGISGTSTKKRDDFNRMIRDAKAGLFDFIITKEISRFSRSTLDSIKYTQELLEHNVGVFFQNDNINTLDTDSEFRLVIMAGVAQDEVRKLSERLKFGFRQAIKNGHVLGNDKLYGYDKKDCVLTINEEEATIVRTIFDLYANHRLGTRKISQKLFEMGYTSREGNAFNVLTIRHMLENPKYKGWYCGNKTQNLDYRTKKKVFLDESEWVMYPDPTIPAIVSEELWDRANALYKAGPQFPQTFPYSPIPAFPHKPLRRLNPRGVNLWVHIYFYKHHQSGRCELPDLLKQWSCLNRHQPAPTEDLESLKLLAFASDSDVCIAFPKCCHASDNILLRFPSCSFLTSPICIFKLLYHDFTK